MAIDIGNGVSHCGNHAVEVVHRREHHRGRFCRRQYIGGADSLNDAHVVCVGECPLGDWVRNTVNRDRLSTGTDVIVRLRINGDRCLFVGHIGVIFCIRGRRDFDENVRIGRFTVDVFDCVVDWRNRAVEVFGRSEHQRGRFGRSQFVSGCDNYRIAPCIGVGQRTFSGWIRNRVDGD